MPPTPAERDTPFLPRNGLAAFPADGKIVNPYPARTAKIMWEHRLPDVGFQRRDSGWGSLWKTVASTAIGHTLMTKGTSDGPPHTRRICATMDSRSGLSVGERRERKT